MTKWIIDFETDESNRLMNELHNKYFDSTGWNEYSEEYEQYICKMFVKGLTREGKKLLEKRERK